VQKNKKKRKTASESSSTKLAHQWESLGNPCAWFEDYDRCFVFKGKKRDTKKTNFCLELQLGASPATSTIVSSLNPALFRDTNNSNAPIENPN